ncbi:MAG: BrxA/BrxB family bacilliredoxin [Planctomycetes bacterium]|nr:BrxA/BrxB family bacilliredoxin [Planctomycetota bacterium]
MYPPQLTQPMREELSTAGVTELTTAQEVDEAVAKGGSCLIYINSVCGCAAGSARPGLIHAKQNAAKTPDQICTVFAGVDGEAVAQARGHFAEYPASSPSAALLVDGEVVWMLHRHQIEGRHAGEIAEALTAAWNEHC